ncbi:larval/pupal cuticle protein H1C-like [Drosophila hydei]|uniref:Larval/pupal cuticle protein H1C-like n=1 Tax=Drosophila hydei TaxID=7224 RepID=A0A6J1LJT2_DROHY|nr:larval/pupal cuticle protein H1C-like [Drosophila hydei]
MKFLICLALCIVSAQAGLLTAPVTRYAAVAPIATYSAVAPITTYSAVAPVRYSSYAAAAVVPVYRTPVTTYAAAPAAVYASPLWKK